MKKNEGKMVATDHEMKVEIIHRKTIKPSSPTPFHLRDFDLSIIDQIAPVVYVPLILFYPNIANNNINIIIAEKSQHLRQSLSETLTHFYPLAGRIMRIDNPYIECNDEGAELVEARINCSLSEFLEKPDPQMLRKFLPIAVECKEILEMERLLLVQATFFRCGGMAIGLSISHKFADASTFSTFINTWAQISLGSMDSLVLPEFGAASLLPSLDLSINSQQLGLPVIEFMQDKSCKTRRYVFDATSIAALRSRAASPTVENPTRVEAVSALIWKCTMEASRSNNLGDSSSPRHSSWCQNVNMRQRVEPPLPENLVGNLVGYCVAKTEESEIPDLQNLVAKMRKAIEEVNESYSEGIDFEEALQSIQEYANLLKSDEIDNYNCTSWCRFPFYKADFGWGKPVWVSVSGAAFKNMILLMDTKDGDGIEAWLALRQEDMALVESNKGLLDFASSNPSVIY